MRVIVVDYGAGNVESVRRAVWLAGFDPEISSAPEEVLAADRIILPGVGAAGRAVAALRARGLDEALDEAVCRRGRPMLGICLGMQLLAETLYEFGCHRGLGWIPGSVVPMRDVIGDGLRVPHMGWNSVTATDTGAMFFPGSREPGHFYFAHSYALDVRPEDPIAAATVIYGRTMVAAVRWNAVFATQFHPEKSQDSGERLLGAFFDWAP